MVIQTSALTALVVLLAVAGQSPAELAEKERKRREAGGEKARVFTNDDLESPEAKGDEDAAEADPAEREEEARRRVEREAENDRETAERRNEEVQWRVRAAATRERRAAAEARLEQARAKVEALVIDTNPTAGVTDPFREQKLQAERLAAADELAAAEDAMAATAGEFAALEEEARRARVPPGWLREK